MGPRSESPDVTCAGDVMAAAFDRPVISQARSAIAGTAAPRPTQARAPFSTKCVSSSRLNTVPLTLTSGVGFCTKYSPPTFAWPSREKLRDGEYG